MYRMIYCYPRHRKAYWKVLAIVACIMSLLVFKRTITLYYNQDLFVNEGENMEFRHRADKLNSMVTPAVDPRFWLASQYSVCSNLFGNGFSQTVDVCTPEISCLRNPASKATLCVANELTIDRSFISVSKGGEPIDEVLGRSEDDEFPVYQPGALSVAGECIDKKDINSETFPFHLSKMLSNLESNKASSCTSLIEGTTLLVTRYEYANLYHTMTDWYNTYQAWRMTSTPLTQITIIFVDGHSYGALDPAWQMVFGVKPLFISQLSQSTCFRKAVFVPAGYTGALSVNSMTAATNCSNNEFLKDFASHFVASLAVRENTSSRPTILFIFRHDYLAHPRIGMQKASRKISNEEEIVQAVRERFGSVDVKAVSFEQMKIEEQITAVRKSSVIVGMHGAGLSHILFANRGTTLIELDAPEYSGRYHFKMFALYAGVHYIRHPVSSELNGAHYVPVSPLLSIIEGIFSNH